MYTAYMAPDAGDSLLDDRISELEAIARFLHQVLQCVGKSLTYQSMWFIWSSLVQALALFEMQNFPDMPIQTPSHIASPPRPRNLNILLQGDFDIYKPLLQPAHDSLRLFHVWLQDISIPRYTRLYSKLWRIASCSCNQSVHCLTSTSAGMRTPLTLEPRCLMKPLQVLIDGGAA